MQKFFLYARKSTDVEDKQVLSIEAQITELREFAKRENLEIIDVLIEKQSAKTPGRPLFNSMLDRIEQGEANGIIAWHPDRLARNSIDGGKIIYFLDCNKILTLKFPQFWFESTPQGKFMLNIAFGQSKYYVDSLSENTKRGLRQKVRRGEYPSRAPLGYINDSRNKTIVVDKKRSKIVKEIFDIYAQGNSRLEDISNYLQSNGILSKTGKSIHISKVSFILSNPFYYGHFRYAGEIYEGKHQPIISKKVFDTVQNILHSRGRPQKKDKNINGNNPQPYCGLLFCNCGMMITGEYKKKKQKNGNLHYYTYYHCSKKSKTMKCKEPSIRQENLDKQISNLLQKFSLKKEWADYLNHRLDLEEKDIFSSSISFVQSAKDQISDIKTKLQRLLDSYLDQDVDRESYLEKKAKLMSEKKTLEEKIITLEQKQFSWVEPIRKWINEAQNVDKISRDSNLFDKKVIAKEIFGSNLILTNREARFCEPSDSEITSPNQWAPLGVAHQNFNGFSESCVPERVRRFELLLRVWKTRVLTTIRYPRICTYSNTAQEFFQEKSPHYGDLGGLAWQVESLKRMKVDGTFPPTTRSFMMPFQPLRWIASKAPRVTPIRSWSGSLY